MDSDQQPVGEQQPVGGQQPVGQPQADGYRLRVMSYNVHGCRDDTSALATVVRTIAPDVVLVQEAPKRFRWRHHCAELAHSFGMIYAAGGLPGLGNLIVTNQRVRVHHAWYLRYPLTPGRHLRGAAFARCSIGRAPFVVAGSHLATDPTERPGQARLLKTALDELDVPVVLGADLNDEPGGVSWRLLADGLVDAGGGTPTFSVTNPTRRIDAIFADARLPVRGYQVVDSPLVRLASDHFPVVVDLILPAG